MISGIIFIPPELITLSNLPFQIKDDEFFKSTKSFVYKGLSNIAGALIIKQFLSSIWNETPGTATNG